jgi:phenylacetate-CoA ligase
MLSTWAWQSYFLARRLPAAWQQLDEHQAFGGPDARRNIARRLLSQMRYFGTRADALPEWREAASIRDPDDLWKIWPQLPIVTRRDLQSRFPAQETQTRFGIKGIVGSTGGSTGEPTSYLHDTEMLRIATSARTYCRLKFGWKPGTATICVWGSERDIGRAANSVRSRVSGHLRRDWIVDGYSLDDRTVDRVLSLVSRKSPVAIYGFTSMLEFVAREVVRRNWNIPAGAVLAAWNGGEMLYPEQAKVFRQAFGVPLLNLYGSRELSAMAYQPGEHAPLIPLRPFLFPEIVDEQGRAAAPGQIGRILWTSTVCRGTPFLRYECGDLGCYDEGGVDESGIRKLSELHGRTAGLITLNGTTINCIFWNHLFKEFAEVEQFQVAQKGQHGLQIRLKGAGFSAPQEDQVRCVLKRLAGDVEVGIVWVERIPLTRQGKLEQVVREP